MKHLATLLAVLGMSASTRLADARVQERAQRASLVPPRFFAKPSKAYRRSGGYYMVRTARECARRVRQRERNAAKAASAAT